MTTVEQSQHREVEKVVAQVVAALRLVSFVNEDEDLQVALARCENWQAENAGRWVAHG